MPRRSAVRLAVLLLLAAGPCLAQSADRPSWRDGVAELPDLRVESLDGDSHHLAEFRGKVVLLSFWASWCAPCIAELPSLMQVQTRLGADKVTVLAVSEDRGGRSDVEKFVASHPDLAPLLGLIDPGRRAAKALGITMVPTTLVIDRGGAEIARLSGGSDWTTPEARQRIDAALAR